MKIVFVSTGVESHSIEILSAFIKKHHHQTALAFDPSLFATEVISDTKLSGLFDTRQVLIKQIIAQKPDFVGFSVFTINYQRALIMARLIKKQNPKIRIIFGGIHPTCVPEMVIKQSCVDIVCVGEGEYALLELLNSPHRTNIKNLWFKKNQKTIKNPLRPLITDLDSLPLPDKDLFYKIYPEFLTDYYTSSSRGCPFGCTFCANNVLNKLQKGLGPPLRRRSPQNLIAELRWAKKRYHINKITFTDDLFVQDTDWLKTFTKLYRRYIRLPYVALTHPAFISRQTAKLLKNSGCYFLLFGIQSASEKIRSQILKRHESNQKIQKAAHYCHLAKLNFSIDHILNLPTQTTKDYLFALQFYHQLRPSIVNCFYLQYFPKTEIINIAQLPTSTIKKINQGQTSTSVVVGFGAKDTADPQLTHANFQFLFLLIPFLPSWALKKIIDKKLYLKKFQPPLFLNALIKILLSLRVDRGGVYWGIIKSTGHFMLYNLKIKCLHP